MAWYDTQASGTCIDYTEWNNMVSEIRYLASSQDIDSWNSARWHNSGIVWDNVSGKWKALKSGAGVSNLSDLVIDSDMDWGGYSIYNMGSLSSQKISGGGITAYWISAQNLSGATTEFTKLTDTPSSYTGKKGKLPMVNDDEDELIFVDIVCANITDKHVYTSNDSVDHPEIVFTSKGVVFG